MRRNSLEHNRRNKALIRHFLFYFLIITSRTGAEPIAEGADKFLGNIIQGAVPSNFDDYWNQVTVENGAKWGMVESSRDQMNWGEITAAYNYSRSTGFPYKQHTFVWGTQEPGWMAGLPAARQREEVEEWIKAFGEKFPETEFIDVVNEPLNKPPSFKNALGGDGETGWDWVVTAFEMAREHCPDAQLLINEFEVEYDATLAAAYLEIIMILRERGLVDGIGIQCHTNEIQRDKPTVEAINGALDTLASSGLPVYVSELDLKGDDRTQLTDYKRLFPVFWEHPAVAGVTLWGYQGNIWNADAVLIRNGAERPAMQWLRSYVDSMKVPTKTVASRENKTTSGIRITALHPDRLSVTTARPQEVSLHMTDMRGGTVYQRNKGMRLDGEFSVSIPVANLTSGMYLLVIRGERGIAVRKVIVGM